MKPSQIKFSRYILLAAAAYNVLWGAVVSLHPQLLLFGNEPTPYLLIILQCVGMLVGVYGLAYYFSSTDPVRYWPLVFTGLVGKVLGPIGAIFYVFKGILTPSFLITNIFNDLIWILPFCFIVSWARSAERKEKVL